MCSGLFTRARILSTITLQSEEFSLEEIRSTPSYIPGNAPLTMPITLQISFHFHLSYIPAENMLRLGSPCLEGKYFQENVFSDFLLFCWVTNWENFYLPKMCKREIVKDARESLMYENEMKLLILC